MIKSKFVISVLGKTKKLLGVEFVESKGKLHIHQQDYIKRICEKFKQYKFPISSLSISKGVVLSKLDCPNSKEEIERMSKLPYRNLIGCLYFLCNRSRPEISHAVNIFSQFQENPGLVHWDALLKLLGYVQYTQHYMLDLSHIIEITVNCFSDSDFASNRDDRISMGGIILFIDNVPIIWRSNKHKCVSLSTMESEYITLTDAAKEILWISRILEKLNNFNPINFNSKSCNLFCDNRAAIDFAKSPIENNRTKHIDVRYHFLRNLIYDELFTLKYIDSKNNIADVFTKDWTLQVFGKDICEDYVLNILISDIKLCNV